MTENQVPAWTPAGELTAVPHEVEALAKAIGKRPANDNVPDGSMFNRVMEITNLPSTNPKRAFGVRKPSAQFIPPVAIIEESVVMALGAAKYGAFNWQDDPVDATTYYSAAMRHLLQWFSGEDVDPESGSSHLAHVRACMAILIDAQASGKLVDDRPACASAGEAIDRLKVAA
ncbi:hypothetical protein J0664_06245 [Rhizobium leguminosarum]|uniref:dATP/dGTP diphosphohydrolase domain-containing protein n=1 Tax=Rhizobium leguminosarum TaxID=384 RepID=UPI001A93378B|nr:dATP/dGTP diphosphohydrolase domain-containing protein [Rhizobium leguminosarum]MBY5553689.1 hypothetical protein [Rhizobium leguminosarum]QSW24896.1 hypothetical protein J0664_06245 [Rhizobium leguminosarum]